jgi:hypothetical protein
MKIRHKTRKTKRKGEEIKTDKKINIFWKMKVNRQVVCTSAKQLKPKLTSRESYIQPRLDAQTQKNLRNQSPHLSWKARIQVGLFGYKVLYLAIRSYKIRVGVQ